MRSFATRGEFRPREALSNEDKIREQQQQDNEMRKALFDAENANIQSIREVTKESQSIEEANREENFRAEEENKKVIRDNYFKNAEAAINAQAEQNKQPDITALTVLGALAPTALDTAKTIFEKREEGKQTAFAQAVYQSGLTAEEAIAIVTADNLQATNALDQNLTVKRLLDRGVSMETIQFIKDVGGGGGNRYLKSKELLQNSVAQSSGFFEESKNKTYRIGNQEATYNQAYQAGNVKLANQIKNRITNEYISGLSAFSPQLLGSEVFPKVRRYWENEGRALNAQARQITEQKLGDERRSLWAGLGTLQQQVDSLGSLSDRRGGRLSLWEFWTDQIKANPAGVDQIVKELNRATIDLNGNGKRQSFLKLYGSDKEYAVFQQQVQRAQDYNYRLDTRERDKNKQALVELKTKLETALYGQEQENDLSQGEIDLARDKYNFEAKERGLPPNPDIFEEFDTKFEQNYAAVKGQAEDLQARGLLTTDALIDLGNPKVIREFSAKAQENDKAFLEDETYKDYSGAVGAMVEKAAGIDDSTNAGDTIKAMSAKQKRLFKKEFMRQLSTGENISPGDAAEQAYMITKRKFEEKLEDPNFKTGDKNSVGEYTEFMTTRNEFGVSISPEQYARDRQAYKRKEIDQRLGMGQTNYVLNSPGVAMDEKEAKQISKNYQFDPYNFQYPPNIEYIARQTGMSPFDVLNRVLKANGAKEVEPTPSIEASMEISPEFQTQINSVNTPEISTRAWGSTNNFDPRIVLNGYGELVQTAAEEFGVNPSYTAALFEIESGMDPNAKSSTGAIGIAQIQQDQHPNYTGGADPTENVRYGTMYYAQLLQQFGDPVIAAGAYNAGPGRMAEYVEIGRPLPTETVNHMAKFSKTLYKFGDVSQLNNPATMREGIRSFTGALTYQDNQEAYVSAGKEFENLGFRVGEHSKFGGTAPVHAGNSYHNYDEAFDITHWKGARLDSIEKTRQLKEAIRSLGLFKEIIGPGDGDPNHESHLHVGGLMRPMTEQDRQTLRQLMS